MKSIAFSYCIDATSQSILIPQKLRLEAASAYLPNTAVKSSL